MSIDLANHRVEIEPTGLRLSGNRLMSINVSSQPGDEAAVARATAEEAIMTKPQHLPPRPFWCSTGVVALAAAAVAVGLYLYSEHRGHLYGMWPYLFLLACPLMHFFMHRGLGHGGHLPAEESGKDGVDGARPRCS